MFKKVLVLSIVATLALTACSKNSNSESKKEQIGVKNLAISIQNGRINDNNLHFSEKQFSKGSNCMAKSLYEKFTFEELVLLSESQNEEEIANLKNTLSPESYDFYLKENMRCFSKDNLATSDVREYLEIAQTDVLRDQSAMSYADEDYNNDLNFNTINFTKLNTANPSITLVSNVLNSTSPTTQIAVLVNSPVEIVLQARSTEGMCYFVKLPFRDMTLYGKARILPDSSCPREADSYITEDRKKAWS